MASVYNKCAKNLEENLYENPGRTRGIILVQFDNSKHFPAHGVGVQQMREKLGKIPQFSSFESMHCSVGVAEYLHERLDIVPVDLTESLAHQTKELFISSLLCAAIYDHVTELHLLARLQVQLQKFVNCLLEV